jgi:hypothetical protein
MNTPIHRRRPATRALLRFFSAAAALAAASARADTKEDAKPYTLFMGADVAVSVSSGVYPVQDVSGSSWIVRMKGQPVKVMTKDTSFDLKITPGLRLTEVSASVSGLKAEPAYSPGHDPFAKFTQQTNQAASDAAESQFAANAANAQMANAVAYSSMHAPSGPGAGASSLTTASQQQFMANATAQVAAANVSMGASPGYAVGPDTVFDTDRFDAMEVNFEVSAGRPLDHPYVVLIARYRDRSASEGAYHNWICAEALDPVGPKPTKVRILRGGLPVGFEMKDLQVHLYNGGLEVATNVAANRVALSRDDAFEYVKMDYLSSHPDATLPAAPAMGKLPADLPSRLAQGQFSEAIFVKVSKDGQAADAYLDEACSRRVDDPYVATVLRDLRFEPALRNGKPVDGVAKLNLGQLVL